MMNNFFLRNSIILKLKALAFNYYKFIKNLSFVKRIKFIVIVFKNRFFNKTIKRQTKNYKNIPIIIISFNQLYYLKKLINFLRYNGYTNIVIIDNNSDYAPLLAYFEEIELSIKIHKLSENYGHMVFWKKNELFNLYSKGYYVVTDADIVPDKDCPSDFLRKFRNILDKNRELSKVGFSLQIDDIPTTNPKKDTIIKWEEKFWKEKTTDGNFMARIDTTFALYPPKNQWFLRKNFYHAIRTNKPYVSKHGGWYLNSKELTEEQKYYQEKANSSSSWKVDEKGDLDSIVCY